jgi:hypothetical protein
MCETDHNFIDRAEQQHRYLVLEKRAIKSVRGLGHINSADGNIALAGYRDADCV